MGSGVGRPPLAERVVRVRHLVGAHLAEAPVVGGHLAEARGAPLAGVQLGGPW